MATTQPAPSVTELETSVDQSTPATSSQSSQPNLASRGSRGTRGSRTRGSRGTGGIRRAPRNIRKDKQRVPRSNETRSNEAVSDSTAGGPTKEFPVFMIYSNWSLKNLQECLANLGNGNVGALHIDRDRNGEETNRTIGLIDESVYAAAVGAGYTGNSQISISRYQLRKNSYPNHDQAYSFFIPLPKNFAMSEIECRTQLEARFNQFIQFNLLKAGDYKISVPLVSREADQANTRGFCFVSFKRSVDHDTIAVVKVLLDNTWWFSPAAAASEGEHWRELLRCYWSKSRQSRPRDENRPNPSDRPMTRSQQPTQASLAPVSCSKCQCSPCGCASTSTCEGGVCMAPAKVCDNAACSCPNCECDPCTCE